MFGHGRKAIQGRAWWMAILVAFTFFLFSAPMVGSNGTTCPWLQGSLSGAEIRNLARNFEYSLVDGSRYRLKNGMYESGQGLDDYINLKLAALALGDLNGDGQSEAAVVLVSNFGGSGSFYEITVLINRGQDLEQTNNLELGDRVEIKKLAIAGGKIRLDLLTHGPDDPMCCPSQKATLTFGLGAGRLQLLE